MEKHLFEFIKDIFKPLLAYWKTFLFLLLETERYHARPEYLFGKELRESKGYVKWTEFIMISIGIIVAIDMFVFNSIVMQLLDKYRGSTKLLDLPFIKEWLLALQYIAFFLVSPVMATEIACRKLYKHRRISPRFITTVSPLFALDLLLASVLSMIFNSLGVTKVMSPDVMPINVVAFGINFWFVGFIFPRHLAYRYNLSILKAISILVTSPIILMIYFAGTFYAVGIYWGGYFVNIGMRLLLVPVTLLYQKITYNKISFKDIVKPNEYRPRFASKWMIILIVLVVIVMFLGTTLRNLLMN
jgi:hypothetical protein